MKGHYPAGISASYRKYLVKCYNYNMYPKLSEEEVNDITSKDCYYCGSAAPVGMARISFDKDLVLGNIRSCCSNCAMMKATFTEKDFLELITKITNGILSKS